MTGRHAAFGTSLLAGVLALALGLAGRAAGQEPPRPPGAFPLPEWRVGDYWVVAVVRRDRSEEITGIPENPDPPPTVPGYPPLQGPGASREVPNGRYRLEVAEAGVPVEHVYTYETDPPFTEEDDLREPPAPSEETPGTPRTVTVRHTYTCFRVRLSLVRENGTLEPLADLFHDALGLRLRRIDALGAGGASAPPAGPEGRSEMIRGDVALFPRSDSFVGFPFSFPDLLSLSTEDRPNVIDVPGRGGVRQTALRRAGSGGAPPRWLIVLRRAREGSQAGVEIEWPEGMGWWSRCASGDLRATLEDHGGPPR